MTASSFPTSAYRFLCSPHLNSICWGPELDTTITQGLPKQGEVKAKTVLAQEPALDTHWALMLRVQFHGTAKPASKLPAAKRGLLRSPPSLNPLSVPAHTLGLVLAHPQITQEPFALQAWKYSPLFLARFVFCHCSALNWLPGWSEEPQQLLELGRVHQGEVGGAGPSPFGSSDVLKLVRSSHEITSCETERRTGHRRVNPPQVSRTNTLRTSGDADGVITTSHNQKWDLCTTYSVSTTSHCNGLQIQLCIKFNYASHRNRQCSSPPLFPLPFSSDSRADSCTGAFRIVGVCQAPGDRRLRTRAEIQAAHPSVRDSLTLSFHLIPCFPILKGIQFFVRNFPQLLCFDDDSQLRVITKFH